MLQYYITNSLGMDQSKDKTHFIGRVGLQRPR
jgi:hypothetical protein